MEFRNVRTRRNTGPFGMLFGSVIMVIIGIILFMVSGFITSQDASLKERCTYEVQATVVGFERSDSGNSKAPTPVFEYSYNDKNYTSKTGTYSDSFKNIFQVGQSYKIYIDPNDPMEFYSEEIAKTSGTFIKISRWGGIGLVILGIISFAISLVKVIVIGGAIGLAITELFKNRNSNSF